MPEVYGVEQVVDASLFARFASDEERATFRADIEHMAVLRLEAAGITATRAGWRSGTIETPEGPATVEVLTMEGVKTS